MPSLTEKLKFLNKILGECQISRDSENASFVCPSCCDSRFSKKKKLVVKLDSDVFHCWVCGIKGKNLYNLLGDIAICVDELKKEAKEQQKKTKDHLAHLFIHGALHLMGFDHRNKSDRNCMEDLERKVLYQLGIDDPY